MRAADGPLMSGATARRCGARRGVGLSVLPIAIGGGCGKPTLWMVESAVVGRVLLAFGSSCSRASFVICHAPSAVVI